MKSITKEAAWNFVTAVEYLKGLLENVDVSKDFAGDPEDLVTAWDLITDNEVYDTLRAIAGL